MLGAELGGLEEGQKGMRISLLDLNGLFIYGGSAGTVIFFKKAMCEI